MMKKALTAGLGIAVGAAVFACGSCLGWMGDLSLQAIGALGVLSCCIVWWIAGLFPEFVTALIMAAAFVVGCQVPTTTVFSAFASSTWWLLVAAFALGFGMQKSGLMARMAAAVLRIFPNTFNMQAAGLIATGTLVGPFIPSLSAKATMLAPLSMGISDSLGYERKGRQATGLFLAMFTGIRTVGPAVISSSIIGYGLLATLPADVAAQFPMANWFLCMLPWFVFVMMANYVAIVLMFGPKRETHSKAGSDDATGDVAVATDTGNPAANSANTNATSASAREGTVVEAGMTAPEKVAAKATMSADAATQPSRKQTTHTPMTSAEKRMAAIMGICVLLWVTEPLHAVPSHIVAIAAMVAMLAFGVVDAKQLRQGIAWDSLIFIGCVLGLADVFAALGIDRWIIGSCTPAFAALAQNPYLFVVGICLATIALRFVIVSEMAYINIFMAFMVPVALTLGISPWIIGVCVYAVVNPWFVLYQNPIYLSAYYATEGKMAKQSSSAAYCAIYLAICIAGLFVSVPLWQSLGLM